MKTLYLDCGMGAAGDMLTAALIELLPDPDSCIEELNALKIPDVHFSKERAVKCGVTGTHITVTVHGEEEGAHPHHAHHEHHHPHSSLHAIEHIVRDLPLSETVRKNILAVFGLIAEAESKVHGVPVSEIHFHEVGTMDAVADVTAVCMIMERLAPDSVVASPVHVGCGQVHCAHGILPIPAPATAYILRDTPIYGGAVQGELCTPTGAALLRHFVDRFGDMPVLRTTAIGYGMGKKDFPRANCVRAMLGETKDQTDEVLELSCNVDDMTAEAIGFAAERLFDGGALDVYTTPIGMKKSRPGTLIRVMCTAERKEKILELLFRHTTTIGVREAVMRRYVLERSEEVVHTPLGDLRRKRSTGYGITRIKWEHDDLARIASEQNISLEEVKNKIQS